MLQGQRDLLTVSRTDTLRTGAARHCAARAFYMHEDHRGTNILKLIASYAYKERKNLGQQFHYGEGLVGQCALEKETHPAHRGARTITSGSLRVWEKLRRLNIVVASGPI